MRTVACFGHSFVPDDISAKIEKEVLKLLKEEPETEFLVGHQGQFDSIVYHTLCSLEKKFPNLNYKIVLAYIPEKKEIYEPYPPERTYYPEGLELVHPKYAITRRNRWMVEQCDIVLCYIAHSWGGAQQFVRQAERKGRKIINIIER